MALLEVLEENERDIVYAAQDERGIAVAFANGGRENLHVASLKAGAIRGNHTHDGDETLCIMGGREICELVVEDTVSGIQEIVQVHENISTYRIKAGLKHTVQNIGGKDFYLISFLTKTGS